MRDIYVICCSTVLDSSGVRGSVHVNDLDASLFISNEGIQFSNTRASLHTRVNSDRGDSITSMISNGRVSSDLGFS